MESRRDILAVKFGPDIADIVDEYIERMRELEDASYRHAYEAMADELQRVINGIKRDLMEPYVAMPGYYRLRDLDLSPGIGRYWRVRSSLKFSWIVNSHYPAACCVGFPFFFFLRYMCKRPTHMSHLESYPLTHKIEQVPPGDVITGGTFPSFASGCLY